MAEPARLGGYIHRVAVNLVIGDYRKSRARAEDGDQAALEEMKDHSQDQLNGVVVKEEVKLVRQVIGELASERDRQLLFRFYVADQDKHEIMELLGLDSLHFNRVLFRARQRFASLWQNRSQKFNSLVFFFLFIYFGITSDLSAVNQQGDLLRRRKVK